MLAYEQKISRLLSISILHYMSLRLTVAAYFVHFLDNIRSEERNYTGLKGGLV